MRREVNAEPRFYAKPHVYRALMNPVARWRTRTKVERALERFSGNRRQAAEALNISAVTLWRKMKQYGLGA